MRAVLALAPRLHRSGGSLTTGLAVAAFAVTTAFALSVLGGLLGFVERADDPPAPFTPFDAGPYAVMAGIAAVLLLVPLVSLGGAAARLGVSRRDARLSTLRLLGVTPAEVVALTVVETALQGLVGALVGAVGYAALLPVWTRIPFQGVPFTAGELWVGVPALAAVLLGVPLLAALSGTVSLRRVVVSPLGVARRQTPPGMRWYRALLLVVALVGFVAVTKVVSGLEAAVVYGALLGMLALAFVGLNLVGPWIIGLTGRLMAWRARTPATLLAARRLVDDPRASWRVVGGLGLAAFVAGCLSILPAIASTSPVSSDPVERFLLQDVVTGGLLTLAISFTVAAVSAGIQQAASVLDRRREYALQRLAGVPVELFDSARRREVLLPLLLVAGTSAGVALVLSALVFGAASATDGSGLLLVLGFLAGGVLLMLAATETSRPLLRSTLRDTVVRAD
ncbi:FtsX-like permease family protein [Cellulomonas sp. NPDC055163]